MRGPLGGRRRIGLPLSLDPMSDLLNRDRLSRLLDRYLADEIEFWPFHSEFMELALPMFDGALVPFDARLQALDDMYELVYMAAPDPVSAEGQRDGIIGSAELKQRLSGMRVKAGV